MNCTSHLTFHTSQIKAMSGKKSKELLQMIDQQNCKISESVAPILYSGVFDF